MTVMSEVIDVLTQGSDRPLRRLFAYYAVIALIVVALATFFPRIALLIAGRSSGSAARIRNASSSMVDHPSPSIVRAFGLKRTGYVVSRQGGLNCWPHRLWLRRRKPIEHRPPQNQRPERQPSARLRACSHFRKSRCAAWRDVNPADSSE